jgi:hypothetical protein
MTRITPWNRNEFFTSDTVANDFAQILVLNFGEEILCYRIWEAGIALSSCWSATLALDAQSWIVVDRNFVCEEISFYPQSHLRASHPLSSLWLSRIR